MVPKQDSNKFLTRRNILLAFIIVLVIEAVWAYQALVKGSFVNNDRAVAVKPKPTTISLSSDTTSLKLGQKTTVSINLSSGRRIDGVDLIITYDPKLLSVEPAPDGLPVRVGTMFSDYPQDPLNDTAGRITISGITSLQGGVLGNGVFGSIVFTAKAAGQTKVSVLFTPGVTTTSNVAETKTGKNILEQVNNLDLNITP